MEEIESFKFSSKFGMCDINWINEKRSKQFQNSYKCHTSKYGYHPTMNMVNFMNLGIDIGYQSKDRGCEVKSN
jgi:hypothetical protein